MREHEVNLHDDWLASKYVQRSDSVIALTDVALQLRLVECVRQLLRLLAVGQDNLPPVDAGYPVAYVLVGSRRRVNRKEDLVLHYNSLPMILRRPTTCLHLLHIRWCECAKKRLPQTGQVLLTE